MRRKRRHSRPYYTLSYEEYKIRYIANKNPRIIKGINIEGLNKYMYHLLVPNLFYFFTDLMYIHARGWIFYYVSSDKLYKVKCFPNFLQAD